VESALQSLGPFSGLTVVATSAGAGDAGKLASLDGTGRFEFARERMRVMTANTPAEAVREAYGAGQRRFGENYLQEGVDKIAALQDLNIEWHFIGPIQSNKTRPIAEHFAWVHSVDRLKIAERLSAQRPAHLPPLSRVLLQPQQRTTKPLRAQPPSLILNLQ